MVLGEGFNEAWRAEIEGESLGSPVHADGGFNAWWLPGADGRVVVHLGWTAQRPLSIALALSALAGLVAAALVIRDRRSGSAPPSPATLRPQWGTTRGFRAAST